MNEQLLFEIPTQEVRWKSGGKDYGFSVRGLTDEDLVKLARDNDESLDKIFQIYQENKGSDLSEVADGDVSEFGQVLISEVPSLAAQLIALAADRPGGAEVIRRMPAPIKLQALSAVWQLTVVDTGGLEPFLKQVLSLLNGMKGNVTGLSQMIKGAEKSSTAGDSGT